MTEKSLKNCERIYLEAFILPKKEITLNDMVFADLWLHRGKTPVEKVIRDLFTEEELQR